MHLMRIESNDPNLGRTRQGPRILGRMGNCKNWLQALVLRCLLNPSHPESPDGADAPAGSATNLGRRSFHGLSENETHFRLHDLDE